MLFRHRAATRRRGGGQRAGKYWSFCKFFFAPPLYRRCAQQTRTLGGTGASAPLFTKGGGHWMAHYLILRQERRVRKKKILNECFLE